MKKECRAEAVAVSGFSFQLICYWIGNHFDGVGDKLCEKIPEFIQAGMGRVEAGEQLEALFSDEYGKSKSYWRGLAATAINRSRTFGEISGYEEAGVATYEILAVMDERTSPVCKFMNGKVFKVKTAAKTRDDIINSEPQAVKTNHPWLSFKDVQNMTDEQLQAAGFVMPPFHFHCRTTTVQRDFEPVGHEAEKPETREIQSLAEAQNFEELRDFMKKNYDVEIDKGVSKLDFMSIHEGAQGIEYVLSKFPNSWMALKKVACEDRDVDTIMATSYQDAAIYFNNRYYKTREDAKKANESTSGWNPRNSNCYGTGAHEAGHILEKFIIDLYNNGDETLGRREWAKETQAKRIVNAAFKKLKQEPENKLLKKNEAKEAISGYAKDSRSASECLAEAVEDYALNKDKAAPLSRCIWEELKGEF